MVDLDGARLALCALLVEARLAVAALILVEIAHVHALLALERPLVDGVLFDVRLFKFLGGRELPSRRRRLRRGRDGARDAGSARHRTGTSCGAVLPRRAHVLPLRARKTALSLRTRVLSRRAHILPLRTVGAVGGTPLSLPLRRAIAARRRLRARAFGLLGAGGPLFFARPLAFLGFGHSLNGLRRGRGFGGLRLRRGLGGLNGLNRRGLALLLPLRLRFGGARFFFPARLLFPAAVDDGLPLAELFRDLAELSLAARDCFYADLVVPQKGAQFFDILVCHGSSIPSCGTLRLTYTFFVLPPKGRSFYCGASGLSRKIASAKALSRTAASLQPSLPVIAPSSSAHIKGQEKCSLSFCISFLEFSDAVTSATSRNTFLEAAVPLMPSVSFPARLAKPR